MMIEVKNVSKNYGNFEAVKDVSFSVGKAAVLGFLGPNGSGKTTIMKMLSGYHLPSCGQILIGGVCAQENPVAVKNLIGYLPESVPLYGEMSADEYLRFAAAARCVPKAERQSAVDRAAAACGLEGAARKQRIDSLSKGYKQRVGLAQAIVHDPPVIILDEPGSGLDPNQIIEMRSLIRELGKRKTVILSTHILQEVESVCSHVLILNGGRIAAQGTPEEIAWTLKDAPEAASSDDSGGAGGGSSADSADAWELELKGAGTLDAAEVKRRLADLGGGNGNGELSGVFAENLETGSVRLCFTMSGTCGGARAGGANIDSGEVVFNWVVQQGYKITSMNRKKLTLEDIFVQLTSKPLTRKPLTGEPSANEPPEHKGKNQ
ncbi:MAG: ABC transporter ATP-binding protein [Treponema sp.]|nr:ABC transporter ATP-binding protein [Treponema sp.]